MLARANENHTGGIMSKEEEAHETNVLDVQPGDYKRSKSVLFLGDRTYKDWT